MSKPSIAKLERQAKKRKQREQHKHQAKQGVLKPIKQTIPNRKSIWKSVAEETAARQKIAEETLKVYRQVLPGLLMKLGKIPDPRHPNKIKHHVTVLMLYGILMFVFQMSSRRETNTELTKPEFMASLQEAFPELTSMPHQDTLCRLLMKMEDVNQIENLYVDVLKGLIRKKTFRDLLWKKRYLVAIDGTQKHVFDECWDERFLRRKVGKEGELQYYAYVLEACLVFSNGMVLPLMSEFLENSEELEQAKTDEQWKQDCEIKAFHRLAIRLKQQFPKLSLTLLLDGLYANGQVFERCRKYKWEFMIVLKDGCLRSVWKEVEALLKLDKKNEQQFNQTWEGRAQQFRWVNDIEYEYGTNGTKVQTLHVVICEEAWEEVDKSTRKIVHKTSRHAWVSSEPMSRKNVHERCNLAARKRWLQENNILKEKHQGYKYEHVFSHDWNAMRGYHYLMHIARVMNELAQYSIYLAEEVKKMGIRGIISFFRETMSCHKINTERIQCLVKESHQLRLVWEEKKKAGQAA